MAERNATTADVDRVSRAVEVYAEQDAADHRLMRTEATADRTAVREEVATLRTDISTLRDVVVELKVDSTEQNGKLDTLIERTAKDDKDADTKALAKTATKEHGRALKRTGFAGLFTLLGILVKHFFL